MLFQVPAQVHKSLSKGSEMPSCGACFLAFLAPNKGREIGGGRATRQPGQVRKEAALTRSGSGRSSVSYLFFERIAHKAASPPCAGCALVYSASRLRETINCGSIDDRRWHSFGVPQQPGRHPPERVRSRRSAGSRQALP